MQTSQNDKYTKKEILLRTVGKIIKEKRKQKGKGILLLAYEYDIPSSSLDKVEKGLRDPQLTTLWRIANALDMTFGEFIATLEQKLPKDFQLIEEK
ncbi:MAG: helix-turn-helix transcriptional regulator [Candidatus Gastranaerophilales bacterium]|nr:helix-turn-helix transcriptional regulator [Candidatus Gastranaerophilales bacterium]